MNIQSAWRRNQKYTLFPGDCASLLQSLPDESVDLVFSSPPYCIGKAYEDKTKAEDFLKDHKTILPEIARVTKTGGSICWQVGYHVSAGVVVPLDFVVYQILVEKCPSVFLRNRIVWTFGHGLHSAERFSGRHETLLWFTKGDPYVFNLDDVRVPQKYPGKKHYKGEQKGHPSGNPKGKNPTDVWDIPNVKANHVEKTAHPCQFPIALAQRAIRAFTNPGDLVLDPYAGAGTTGAACALLGRKFVGAELESKYYRIAMQRIRDAMEKTLPFRPEDKPVYRPAPNTPLTTVPAEWGERLNHHRQDI
jgi:adenine-specific DNA-methyltransferase